MTSTEVRALVVEALRDASTAAGNYRHYRAEPAADALLAAINKAGWAVVPREPTENMTAVFAHINSEWFNDRAPIGEHVYGHSLKAAWPAMIAAGEARE